MFIMARVHICIVSDHLEANLIPVLQLKPSEVILVASQAMKKKADTLQTVISDALPDTHVQVHVGLPEANISEIEDFGLDLEEKLSAEFGSETLVYNATGGSKLHALIFSQIFDASDIIYAHTQTNTLMNLSMSNKRAAASDILPVLTASIYLQCNGKRLRSHRSSSEEWTNLAMERKAVTLLLGKPKHESVQWMIGDLNWMIRRNGVLDNQGRQVGTVFNAHKAIQRLKKKPVRDTLALIDKLCDTGLLARGDDDRTIVFQNADSAEYLSGGWIEEYAYLIGMKLGVQEVLSSAQITDEANRKLDVRNEIDCLMVHNNRMLLIECKTAYYSENESEQEMLTKLDSLGSRSGGLFGTNVLLSFRDVSANMSNRAQSLGIKVLDSANLKYFEPCVKHWMETGVFRLPE